MLFLFPLFDCHVNVADFCLKVYGSDFYLSVEGVDFVMQVYGADFYL